MLLARSCAGLRVLAERIWSSYKVLQNSVAVTPTTRRKIRPKWLGLVYPTSSAISMRPREVSRISCCVAGDPFSLHILQRRHPRCLFERRKELIHRNVDYDEIEFLPHHMRIVVDTGFGCRCAGTCARRRGRSVPIHRRRKNCRHKPARITRDGAKLFTSRGPRGRIRLMSRM